MFLRIARWKKCLELHQRCEIASSHYRVCNLQSILFYLLTYFLFAFISPKDTINAIPPHWADGVKYSTSSPGAVSIFIHAVACADSVMHLSALRSYKLYNRSYYVVRQSLLQVEGLSGLLLDLDRLVLTQTSGWMKSFKIESLLPLKSTNYHLFYNLKWHHSQNKSLLF